MYIEITVNLKCWKFVELFHLRWQTLIPGGNQYTENDLIVAESWYIIQLQNNQVDKIHKLPIINFAPNSLATSLIRNTRNAEV